MTLPEMSEVGQFVVAAIAIVATLATFAYQMSQSRKLKRQEVYQELELASNEIFRYEAQYAAILQHILCAERTDRIYTGEEKGVADNLIFQTLNLFEIATNFRDQGIFDAKVYASWVIWQYDTLDSWYFRENWPNYRTNYTRELRKIFDEPVRKYKSFADEEARQNDFFEHVAKVLNCEEIQQVLEDRFEEDSTPPREAKETSPKTDLDIKWVDEPQELSRLSGLFTRELRKYPEYISHGEIHYGMTTDGKNWSDNINDINDKTFAAIAADNPVETAAAAYGKDGDILGLAIVSWNENDAFPYAILQDMLVTENDRSKGVGGQLLEFVEQEANSRNCKWFLLESGKRNKKAHEFFEHRGFGHLSNVYGKKLS
ncbi:GNAT family N-acetyltransferase [Emcibacter sp.]|uniref:GNAT family N-acetyltransferase n=1 Tax=Emcibacter sp. TaxID=1979954 RepID=UPI003A916901